MIETAKMLIEAFDEAGKELMQKTGEQLRNIDLSINGLDYQSYLRPILQYMVEVGTPVRPVKAGLRWHCDRCRRPIQERWTHCAWCGQRLEWEEDSAQ